MRNLILIFCLIISISVAAQNYDKQWKEVYELELNGSYKSLNTKLEQIYKTAKKEKNEAQRAKAFIFQMKVANTLKEIDLPTKFSRLELEIEEATGIYKEVFRWYYIQTLLNSQDNLLDDYFVVSSKDSLSTASPKDIKLWEKSQYYNFIIEQVDLLFKNEKLLKETHLEQIKDLINYDFIENNLNQSAYDFFAINFINLYIHEFDDYKFKNDFFSRFDTTFIDSTLVLRRRKSYTFLKDELAKKSYFLLQNLERNYLENKQDLLLDKIRFHRLEIIVKQKYKIDKSYQELGANLKTNYYKNRWHSMYAHKLIKDANTHDRKDYLDEALKIIGEVKKNKYENDEIETVQELENLINEKAFSINLNAEVYEDEPVKYLIEYRNIDSLHLAYYDFSKQKIVNDSIYKDVIKNHQPLKKISYSLSESPHYFKNSIEVLGEKMPLGNYLLVAYSSLEDLEKYDSNKVHIFKTTNVKLIAKNINKEQSAVFILHPKTGKPYKNKVALYKGKRYRSDENGKIVLPSNEINNRRYSITVFVNNEVYTAFINANNYGTSIVNNDSKPSINVELFTDRAIYRPGHEVHFKGILYEINLDQKQVTPNKSFKVKLEVGNNKLDEMILTTNEWGGFSGKFTLPAVIPLGEFSLTVEKLDEYVNEIECKFWEEFTLPKKKFNYVVEEYKRPTFEIKVEEIKHNVFLDEPVTIKGKAQSFAGGAIANAEVKLKIKLNVQNSQKRELINISEKLKTDNQGNFEYTFVISSDSITIDLKKQIFHEELKFNIEIIDETGEVKETMSSFYVSNLATILTINTEQEFKTNKPLICQVQSFTNNRDFMPVTGIIKIYRTLPIDKFYKQRSWKNPKTNSIDEETFRRLFPFEAYTAEELKTHDETLIYEKTFTTVEGKDFELDIKDWKTGSYKMVFEAIDSKLKIPIKDNSYFSVENVDEKIATNKNFSMKIHPSSTLKNLVLDVNSIYNDLDLFIEYFDRDATIKTKVFNLKDNSQIINIPLVQSNENEYVGVQYFFVKDHELYLQKIYYNLQIEKIKENEQWTAEWQLWNNKLNPAQQYQWKLIFKDAKLKNEFQGEFLASMYDASLDLLLKDQWKTRSNASINFAYAYFSFPQGVREVLGKSITFSFPNYSKPLYWNTWENFGYDFNTKPNYITYHDKTFEMNNYQIEVRDKKTDKFISNAKVFNIKSYTNSTTNEHGFANIFDSSKPSIVVLALGYKETLIQLKDKFTVVYLENDEVEVSDKTYTNFLYKQKNIDNIMPTYYAFSYIINDINSPYFSFEKLFRIPKSDFKSITESGMDYSHGTNNGVKSNSAVISENVKFESGNDEFRISVQMEPNLLISSEEIENTHGNIDLRKNLNETAFFFPHLKTSKKGEVLIDFTAPESLTKWRFRGLAHNKKADFIYVESISRTQKDIMIQPNMPRFVRETDEIELKARVTNTKSDKVKVTAMLRLFNTITGEDLSKQIIKTNVVVSENIEALSSNSVSWKVQIPKNIEGLQYRISVQSGNFTDGEESVIPVLSNRQIVAESIPIWQNVNENKSYELTNLINNKSTTLDNQLLRIDVSDNVTWLMLQSFPYLMDYPYDCSEQLFAKYFAATIATHIVNENDAIRKLVNEWSKNPSSKLDENQELKQILSQEIPWINNLISSDEKKKQFANNLDITRLGELTERIENKLIERQMHSGALPWFDGGRENLKITQQILLTAAQLRNLGVKTNFLKPEIHFLINAHKYLDNSFINNFSNETNFPEVLNYAFIKSYYKSDFPISIENQEIIDKKFDEYRSNWVDLSLHQKSKMIIVLQRKGDLKWANEIINHLEQSAIVDKTHGMYWRINNSENYYYTNSEVQALIIEAYQIMNMPEEKIQNLFTRLLSEKTNNAWGTTKATTQVLYAFALIKQEISDTNESIQLKVGNQIKEITTDLEIIANQPNDFFSYQWIGENVKPEMGKIEIKNPTRKPIYGGIYWQYSEDMDKIQNSQEGVLSISRNYYIKDKNENWNLVTNETKLTLGQLVKVRIEFEVNNPMSYLHIKDNRPSTFEPVDVLSGQHRTQSLHYYQMTKDTSTNFFIDDLYAGKYFLEYDVRLNNIGSFTSGTSTIQSMYAPAHSAHTSADKIEVQ